MADKLARYRSMRDFERTAEPAGGDAGETGHDRFVIQEHSATRLHWDLRLERDGVLASWAVPNGIPEDPAEDRKAVRTEDHPLEYLEFEGTIPEGTYGAGTMRIWDRGTYVCHKWEPRKVVVSLAGDHVQGRYALFQTGSGKDWMIHRVDPPADPDRDPMPEHVVPMLASPGKGPPGDSGWAYEVDWQGQRAVALCEPGRIRLETRELEDVTALYPELRALTRALGAHSAILDGAIVAFDSEGRPSEERLERRSAAASDSAARRLAKSVPAVYVIFDLLYLDGRSLQQRPYSERRERLERLELSGAAWQTPARHEGDGQALLDATAAQGLAGVVAKRLDSPYRPGARSADWIELRADAPAEEAAGLAALTGGRTSGDAELRAAGRRVKVTNLDKVLYPKTGFTKGEVLDYYVRIAPVLLPHLRDRAISMHRYPDGVEGLRFWEKQCPSRKPRWMRTAPVWSEQKEADIDYCLIDDVPSLAWVANLGSLELHPSLFLCQEVDRPTVLIFDLDPGPGTDLGDCCQVGLRLRGMFEQLGLESFAKTSGSKGLQVYVPLNSEVSFDKTKPFAKAVAETLERAYPDTVVSRMAKAARKGKVYVDWSQNTQHKTTVAPYSLRAKERPTASTPVTWEEVEAGGLVLDAGEMLDRVEEVGDLFAPVLSLRQELPRS